MPMLYLLPSRLRQQRVRSAFLNHCKLTLNQYRPSATNLSTLKMSGKAKVLVTRNDIPPRAFEKLMSAFDIDLFLNKSPMPREELLRRIEGKDGLFCLFTDKIDKEVLDAAGPNLRSVCTMSVGFDHLDVEEMKARGIKVGHTPGVLTDATAEFTIALLLATTRRLFEANKELLNGGWAKSAGSPQWLNGIGLSGATVGVFGLGRIGQAVLKRLQGFNVAKFIYNSRSRRKEGDELGAEFVSFEELLTASDILLVTSALTPETKHKFDEDAFRKMKKSSVFINTSRGGVVDQDALIKALTDGEIRAAGLDVMTPEPLPVDHKLIQTPNLTLMPHIGSSEVTTRETMALLTVDNLIGALGGSDMPARLC